MQAQYVSSDATRTKTRAGRGLVSDRYAATGCHLHFGALENGNYVEPWITCNRLGWTSPFSLRGPFPVQSRGMS